MKSLELFSGAGGLAKGLELAGFDHAMFVEFNKHACNSLKANFDPEKVFCGDVRNFDFDSLSDIDLIAGGPPCQPFSLGGKHNAHADDRDMFPYAAKAVSHYHPKAFLFENVKGLLRDSFAEYFSYVLLRLTYPEMVMQASEGWKDHCKRLQKIDWNKYSGIKYKLSYALLNAANYGVPQVRERVFIVGIRSDIKRAWSFPKPTHSAAALFVDQVVTQNYWKRHGIKPSESAKTEASKLNGNSAGELPFDEPLKPWVTVRDALAGTPHPASKHSIAGHVFQDGARTYAGHTGSFIDLPAKTLKAGVHGVPGGENMIRYEDGTVRYFTAYEGKLFQTFARDYKITGGWGESMRQIGNAVPTMLAEKLGRQLVSVIGKHIVMLAACRT